MPALGGRPVSVLIWTTTPWTIPSNLAIAFHPDFEYGAYDVNGTAVIVATDLAAAVAAKTGRPFDTLLATFPGAVMERPGLPASAVRPRLARRARRLRDARGRHRRGAHGARPRRRRLPHRREVRPRDLRAARRRRPLQRHAWSCFAGLQVWEANPKVEAALADARAALASRGLPPLVPALLALPQPGDLPGHGAVVHRHGGAGPAAARAGGDRRHALDPELGPRAHRRHDRQPARLVHLAPARLGRADPGARLHGVRPGAADRRAGRAGRRRVRHLRRRRLVRAAARGVRAGRARPARRAAARRSSARPTSSTCGSTRGRATRRCCRSARIIAGRPTSISRAATSIAAGSTARCSWASARAGGRRSTRC